MLNLFRPSVNSQAEAFLKELNALCEKYNMCVTPFDVGEFERDFHNSMVVVPFDADSKKYYSEISVIEDDGEDDDD